MDADRPLDAETVTAELGSQDRQRYTAALSQIDEAANRRPVAPLSMPRIEDLIDAHDGDVPEHVLARFIEVVQRYPWFEPPPEPGERHSVALQAAMLHGVGQPAYEVSLALAVDPDAAYAVAFVMRDLLDFPEFDATEGAAVQQVLERLLEAPDTRAAVVDGLASWAFRGQFPELVDRLLEDLEPVERSRILDARN